MRQRAVGKFQVVQKKRSSWGPWRGWNPGAGVCVCVCVSLLADFLF